MTDTKLDYYVGNNVTVHLGSNLDVLPQLADASIDAIVTDPPYELGFMGRSWDSSGIAYNVALWTECLRVLKPGGHLVAFGGTRTYHRLACAIEDAGFEVRDGLVWLYGSGFPKSLDVSKAIDKAAGALRETVGTQRGAGIGGSASFAQDEWTQAQRGTRELPITAPATSDAIRWQGWGTALKPAHEPIVLARKPLEGTVATNVLEHGTGALNVNANRVGSEERINVPAGNQPGGTSLNMSVRGMPKGAEAAAAHGRWPTNVIVTHPPILSSQGEPIGDACSEGCVPGCPVGELDRQSGVKAQRANGCRPLIKGASGADGEGNTSAAYGTESRAAGETVGIDRGDGGGASRFFPVFRYESKAPARERPRLPDGTAHPTVKPLALMRWLVRLITPPDGTVLEPFAGSGTTLEAAIAEGFTAVGIEQHAPYIELCRVRLDKPIAGVLFGDVA